MTVLGKRKAREPDTAPQDAHAIFRRHFEARFEPLAAARPGSDDDHDDDASVSTSASASDGEGDGDEWAGLSDGDALCEGRAALSHRLAPAAHAVEVVDYSSSQTPKAAAMSKRELKAFMSSRPPDQTTQAKDAPPDAHPKPSSASSSTLPEDAPSLLAQDLELRRLLAESHLLSPHPAASLSSSSATVETKPFASGRTRQKTTDLRIQALGSSVSILKQDKMPMKLRKAMVAAASARESKRRREARENGIILEREAAAKGRRQRARDRAVDRPGVGRLKGAELRLSERDVKRIEGGRDVFGRRGKR